MVTRAALALTSARRRLEDRVEQLEERLDGDHAAWSEYLDAVRTLAVLVQASGASATSEPLLTTRQLAERLQVSTKTIRKLKREGRLCPVQQLAKRGLSANRWASP